MPRTTQWLAAAILSIAAVQPNADVEREAHAIEAMLIAPCCFTQQVSVHQSAAADEVRRDLRTRLGAGQSRQVILDAYVARYGVRILAQPPAAGFSRVLHIAPLVALPVSLGVVILLLRRFTRHGASGGLDDETRPIGKVEPEEEVRLEDELRDLD